jgi:hypothetical protein
MELIETETISDVRAALARATSVFNLLAESAPKLAAKALAHVAYLRDYWTTEDLWQSWSDHGRNTAAKILGCPFEGVLPKTNHLEAFNGLLKNKHLKQWQ